MAGKPRLSPLGIEAELRKAVKQQRKGGGYVAGDTLVPADPREIIDDLRFQGELAAGPLASGPTPPAAAGVTHSGKIYVCLAVHMLVDPDRVPDLVERGGEPISYAEKAAMRAETYPEAELLVDAEAALIRTFEEFLSLETIGLGGLVSQPKVVSVPVEIASGLLLDEEE